LHELRGFQSLYGIVGKAGVFVNGVFLERDALNAVMMWPVAVEMSATSIGILYFLKRQCPSKIAHLNVPTSCHITVHIDCIS
jgi:hypothetical protein